MCLHFYLVLFEQVGYSMFLVQYRKVFSDQYNFFERVDLAFALLYVYCVPRRMRGMFLLCIEETIPEILTRRVTVDQAEGLCHRIT